MKKAAYTIVIMVFSILPSLSQVSGVGWVLQIPTTYSNVHILEVFAVKGNPVNFTTSLIPGYSPPRIAINATINRSGDYQFAIRFSATNILGQQGVFVLNTDTKTVDLSILSDSQWLPSRHDSDIEFNANGSQVFYINSDRRLSILYKTGNTWSNGVVSSIRANDSGKGLVRNPINNDLYFIGENNKIYRAYWSNGSWNSVLVSNEQWNNADRHSKLYVSSSGNNIFYITSQRKLAHLYKSGSNWYNGVITNSTVSSGRSFVWSDEDDCLYFIRDDGKICKAYWTSAGWVAFIVSSQQWNTASANSELVKHPTASNIFYVNNNNVICNLYSNGSEWIDNQLNNISDARAKNASSLVWCTENGALYYIGLNNRVSRLTWSNGWVFDLPGTHMALANAGSGLGIYDGVVYFSGTDSKIHYLVNNTSRLEDEIRTEFIGYQEDFISSKGSLDSIDEVKGFDYIDSKMDFSGENNDIKMILADIQEGLVQVYPNPVSEILSINLPIADTYEIQLIDMNGRVVFEEIAFGHEFYIATRNHTNGLYFLRVSNFLTVYQEKIIVQH